MTVRDIECCARPHPWGLKLGVHGTDRLAVRHYEHSRRDSRRECRHIDTPAGMRPVGNPAHVPRAIPEPVAVAGMPFSCVNHNP